MTLKKMTWRVVSLLCLGVACYQGYEVEERLRHIATIGWKGGIEPGLISASILMIVVFFVLTAIFMGIALVATNRLLKERSWFSLAAILSGEILIAGAIIWSALLASPYVDIVNR
jgi:hypothetical protein